MKMLSALAWCVCVAATAPAAEPLAIQVAPGPLPLVQASVAWFQRHYPDDPVVVQTGKMAVAVQALRLRTAEAAVLDRFLSYREYRACLQQQVYPSTHLVALEALAVIVHPDNPVSDVTLDQLGAIYAGAITNWSMVGGGDMGIHPVAYTPGAAAHQRLIALVPDRVRVAWAGSADASTLHVGQDGDVRNLVAGDPAAIGYVRYGFRQGVKTLAVAGVPLAVETVNSQAYVLAQPIFIFTSGTPAPGSRLARFLEIFSTETGAELAGSRGFVPVLPGAGP